MNKYLGLFICLHVIYLRESSFICIDKMPSGLGDLGFRGFRGFLGLGAIKGMGILEKPMAVNGAEPLLGEHISSSELAKL